VREVTRPIVSVAAPAGYGKTTLLVQWAERSGQAVAWVSVDEQDNDSKVLLGDVARAQEAVRPGARPVFVRKAEELLGTGRIESQVAGPQLERIAGDPEPRQVRMLGAACGSQLGSTGNRRDHHA
jgi:hypothetical protein